MKYKSITFKLLSFVIAAFILVTISILILSYVQLIPIADKSQNVIYSEKLDVIWTTLSRIEQKLQKTGLIEAYIDDFKNSAITTLESTYYSAKNQKVQFFILNETGQLLVKPEGATASLSGSEKKNIIKNMTDARGQFTLERGTHPCWYIYRRFEPWGWTICYEVPNTVKYADVRKFISLLLITMAGITIIVAIPLALVIAWLIRPIGLLTKNAAMISAGNLEQPISIDRTDEVGLLAQSFDQMRNSIKEQLEQLTIEVAERTKAEAELKHLRNYLSNIIDSMPSVIVGVDRDKKVTQWNRRAEKNTGISAESAYGKNLAEVYPQLSDQMACITEAITAREIQQITRSRNEAESGVYYEDMTFYPLIANGVEGAVIRIDDVTKAHKLEEELSHGRKLDAIGQLAGGVAHDFNNMLSGILGAVQLLKMLPAASDKKSLEYISMIEKASLRAADLTAKLLAFGRKGKIVSSSLDTQILINDTIAILRRTIDKRIEITFENRAENTFLVGDNSGLQNALLNIGINASHAMPEGGVIAFETKNLWLNQSFCEESTFDIEPGQYLEIEVRDSGCGIAQENMQKIFEPFYTTKETGKGAGLGLAAVYGTVQDHHGLITVSSEVGHGTTFCLLFPTSEDLPRPPTREEAGATHGSGRILLVDDEEIIRVTGKHLLQEIGYSVILASNGLGAVEVFQESHDEIDLVLMDMVMPVMDGREAIEKLREIDQNCKIIIASGFPNGQQGKQLEDSGIKGFIQKPYRVAELSRLLVQILKAES